MFGDDGVELAGPVAETDDSFARSLVSVDEVEHGRQPLDLGSLDVRTLVPVDEQEPAALDAEVIARNLRRTALQAGQQRRAVRTSGRVVDGRSRPAFRNVERLDRGIHSRRGQRFGRRCRGRSVTSGGAATKGGPATGSGRPTGSGTGSGRGGDSRCGGATLAAGGRSLASMDSTRSRMVERMPLACVASRDCFAEALPRQPSKSASESAGGDSGGTAAVSPQPAKRGTSNRNMRVTKCLFV